MSSTGHQTAYDQLHPQVQGWIADQNWLELRPIQEDAIPVVLAGEKDLLISAATASGKTEAAFLPIFSRLLSSPSEGLRAICLSPLKALINDQYERLSLIGDRLGIAVHRWHGDVSAAKKRRLRQQPSGILLITPESVEALFVLRGSQVSDLLSKAQYLVVDELHSFIGSERGQQLQSLLHRIDLLQDRPPRRIALSATLGEPEEARSFLRPGAPQQVALVQSSDSRQELQVIIRGYELAPARPRAREATGQSEADDEQPTPGPKIAADLFKVLRGAHHLVFANRRGRVEEIADALRRMSKARRVPNEFFPHHGSLSKELREYAETRLKSKEAPATIVCTSTLELGIDVGSITSIAQVGPPSSVASLRQRLGRSGRDGGPAILRLYVEESEITSQTPPPYRLRARLVQSIAMIELLVDGWFEPPVLGQLHLSTLVQQVLSRIAERGQIHANRCWVQLCRDGAFPDISGSQFARLLRDMAGHNLIRQLHSGEIIFELAGEQLVNHYDFFTAFSVAEEYRLTCDGRTLGSLPITYPLKVDSAVIFAGKRWRVQAVDDRRKVVNLTPAGGGRVPIFGGNAGWIHDRIRQRMKVVYEANHLPSFLDKTARRLLAEGRGSYREMGLSTNPIQGWGHQSLLFCWRGDRTLSTLLTWLRSKGHRAEIEGVALVVDQSKTANLRGTLLQFSESSLPDPLELSATVANQQTEKHHRYLSSTLLDADYASRALDVQGAWQVVRELVGQI